VSADDIDRYFADLEEPKRSTLEEMRRRILEVIPDAEQGLSYSMPAFRVDGRVVAGLAAFKSHLSYLPHSGSVLPRLTDRTGGYGQTKGSLHFPTDTPLPQELVRELIECKLQEVRARGRRSSGDPSSHADVGRPAATAQVMPPTPRRGSARR
jgi:uncharacterized protein YdhG (YjbR/CyaY superfamily)